MAFEEYTQKRSRYTPDATITINVSGNISINKQCYEQYFKDFVWVKLYFDKETNRIGIKPVREAAFNTYSIRNNRGRSAAISGRSFLQNYNVNFKESRRCRVEYDKENEMLVVDLESGDHGVVNK